MGLPACKRESAARFPVGYPAGPAEADLAIDHKKLTALDQLVGAGNSTTQRQRRQKRSEEIAAELARPKPERRFFSFREIAEELAHIPEEGTSYKQRRERYYRRLLESFRNGSFDRDGVSMVMSSRLFMHTFPREGLLAIETGGEPAIDPKSYRQDYLKRFYLPRALCAEWFAGNNYSWPREWGVNPAASVHREPEVPGPHSGAAPDETLGRTISRPKGSSNRKTGKSRGPYYFELVHWMTAQATSAPATLNASTRELERKIRELWPTRPIPKNARQLPISSSTLRAAIDSARQAALRAVDTAAK